MRATIPEVMEFLLFVCGIPLALFGLGCAIALAVMTVEDWRTRR